jgi:hypothetical protein
VQKLRKRALGLLIASSALGAGMVLSALALSGCFQSPQDESSKPAAASNTPSGVHFIKASGEMAVKLEKMRGQVSALDAQARPAAKTALGPIPPSSSGSGPVSCMLDFSDQTQINPALGGPVCQTHRYASLCGGGNLYNARVLNLYVSDDWGQDMGAGSFFLYNTDYGRPICQCLGTDLLPCESNPALSRQMRAKYVSQWFSATAGGNLFDFQAIRVIGDPIQMWWYLPAENWWYEADLYPGDDTFNIPNVNLILFSSLSGQTQVNVDNIKMLVH